MPAVVTVPQVRSRLNKTTTVDDAEITEMIDAAEAEYARTVGPFAAGKVRVDGGPVVLLPLNVTVTAVTYTDGTVVPLAELDIDAASGILRGNLTRGSRNVTVDFTVAVPANHREAILADVAGVFAATQRGNSPGALPTGYESGLEDRSTPITLFPRIKALAATYSGVA